MTGGGSGHRHRLTIYGPVRGVAVLPDDLIHVTRLAACVTSLSHSADGGWGQFYHTAATLGSTLVATRR